MITGILSKETRGLVQYELSETHLKPKSREHSFVNEPLTRFVKLQVAYAPGLPGTFSSPPRVSDPDIHHGTCMTHVPWCMPGLLSSGFLWCRWRGKRFRHSRRMRNSQFCVSGKRPITYFSVAQSFWHFAQSTAVKPPCYVQHFKTDRIYETDVMNERDFARCAYKMSFGRISYIARGPGLRMLWDIIRYANKMLRHMVMIKLIVWENDTMSSIDPVPKAWNRIMFLWDIKPNMISMG